MSPTSRTWLPLLWHPFSLSDGIPSPHHDIPSVPMAYLRHRWLACPWMASLRQYYGTGSAPITVHTRGPSFPSSSPSQGKLTVHRPLVAPLYPFTESHLHCGLAVRWLPLPTNTCSHLATRGMSSRWRPLHPCGKPFRRNGNPLHLDVSLLHPCPPTSVESYHLCDIPLPLHAMPSPWCPFAPL